MRVRGVGIRPVSAAHQGLLQRHHQPVQPGQSPESHEAGADPGNQWRIQQHDPGDPGLQLLRREYAQIAAQRMPDQPHPVAAAAGQGLDEFGEFIDQIRPADGHRPAGVVAEAQHAGAVEFGLQRVQQLAIDRQRETVGMREDEGVGHGVEDLRWMARATYRPPVHSGS
jgi:hypothetical protein